MSSLLDMNCEIVKTANKLISRTSQKNDITICLQSCKKVSAVTLMNHSRYNTNNLFHVDALPAGVRSGDEVDPGPLPADLAAVRDEVGHVQLLQRVPPISYL